MKRKRLVVFAAINLLLLFAAIFCMVKTCKNNERINNVSAEFRYAETDGKVTLDLTSGKAVTMRFGKNAVCVYDCYLYDNSDAAEILLFVRRYGQENGVTFARKNTELDGIQTELTTARKFLFAVRCRNMKPPQVFAYANTVRKVLSEQGFDVHRMGKDEIKRLIALYFDASLTGENIPDFDGEQYFNLKEAE